MKNERINARLAGLATKKELKQAEFKQHRARKTNRIDTFKMGSIKIEKSEDVACVIQNQSDSGMLLKLQCATTLPKEVIVCIPAAGFRKTAEVQWQKQLYAGVTLV